MICISVKEDVVLQNCTLGKLPSEKAGPLSTENFQDGCKTEDT